MGEVRWRKCDFTGKPPSKRYYHTAVVHKHCMYIFGGYDSDTRLNDLFEFNFQTRNWREVVANGVLPCRRNSHTAVYDSGKMYVFGGWENNRNILNDVHEFDFETETWREIKVNGTPPSKRLTHSAVVSNGCMYVFGGWDGHNFLNDLHEFNLTTHTWRQVVVYGRAPAKRNAFSAVAYNNAMYIFGGYDGRNRLNDLHEFDFATRTWREIMPHSKVPDVRCYHSALVFNNSMYVFGGYTGTQNMNDMQMFDLETRTWEDIPTAGDLPTIRNSHTACMYACMDRGMMFVFGGYNKGQCNADFYECIFPFQMELPPSDFVAQMRWLLANEAFSDITFIVEGKRVPAHKCIVCTRCDYFRALFSSGLKETGISEFRIENVTHPLFLTFLEYLYTGEVQLNPDVAQEMLRVADMYGCQRLKTLCEYELKDCIDDQTVAQLFHMADMYSAPSLRALCLSYIVLHFNTVKLTEGFEELPKELLLELVDAQLSNAA